MKRQIGQERIVKGCGFVAIAEYKMDEKNRTVDYASYMGERMSWDDMVSAFPERWVVLRDTEKDGPDVLSGILVAVKTDDEIIPYEEANLRKGYEFWRTTEGDFYGLVDSNLSISVD